MSIFPFATFESNVRNSSENSIKKCLKIWSPKIKSPKIWSPKFFEVNVPMKCLKIQNKISVFMQVQPRKSYIFPKRKMEWGTYSFALIGVTVFYDHTMIQRKMLHMYELQQTEEI